VREMQEWVDATAKEFLDGNPPRHGNNVMGLVGGLVISVYLRKPYTVAVVTPSDASEEECVGVAKVNWPDKWDEAFGAMVAVKRALKEYWRKSHAGLDSLLSGLVALILR